MDNEQSLSSSANKINILFVVMIVFAVGGIAVAGYFYVQNSKLGVEASQLKNEVLQLKEEISQLEDEKTEAETALAILKATDLAKEAELLRLKLANIEKELNSSNQMVSELSTNMSKIRPYTDATTTIERFFNAPFTQKGLADIDTKISVLQDMEVSNRWMNARGTVDFANNGWGPHDFFQVVFLLNSRIKSLLP
ncbi:MAG: hypothetical protein UW79_C0007G0003 [Candidatus Yanofskybacteria bacterium GW2011_GWA2_44_9]|uniref:Uncharacterized protein n=1 Tax=Candidatus Yanofskybacteria bacterium GW2011_GWA2_44_9 TaxID=1619025 RepID=A0A0G1KF53_9BACT|nr:MAG: hypothetical protein UW79_C0007G0003 [Candidatus Yanofskybacteria bacterium GW2011_GWA2_44_9]OGN05058.1 MAG: hypothetical protein A2659_01355 [Candidatus Yanofskybacteria bacterium RIFCSPHIGHO2_01_FULL_44_24]